ncbi:hypothetical protein PAHAL_8G243800 [Panicum hallii]|uniref:Secreted protein n=1 Tax=Panicum hallii TaxID=206008 RepID=A0A2T8IA46_9POAL|nr:hypothetical protein PAHAL_8G243800 [Panicum hallii]
MPMPSLVWITRVVYVLAFSKSQHGNYPCCPSFASNTDIPHLLSGWHRRAICTNVRWASMDDVLSNSVCRMEEPI